MGFVICDAPKRAEVRSWKSHNAYQGCTMCLQTGIMYSSGEGGRKVIWPFYRDEGEPRTHRGVRDYLQGVDADEGAKSQGLGVVGDSPLMDVPGFDIVLNVPPEPMHLLYEGIVKLLLV